MPFQLNKNIKIFHSDFPKYFPISEPISVTVYLSGLIPKLYQISQFLYDHAQ